VSSAERLGGLARFAEAELTQHILPFWLRLRDPSGQGFAGAADAAGRPDWTAPRGAVLHGRILWVFATSGARYGRADWLDAAGAAWRFLAERLYDQRRGGLAFSTADGQKHLYVQAFGIFGLAAYARATGETAALDLARMLYEIIEKRAGDSVYGGYFEAFDDDWQLQSNALMGFAPGQKSLNAHAHLIEAYAELYRAWPDRGLRERIAALLGLLTGPGFDHDSGAFRHFFQANWRVVSVLRSFGHDIEGAWLLPQIAALLGRETEIRSHLAGMAETIRRQALGADGGLIDGPFDRRKSWWVQAEAAVGFLDAFEQTGEAVFLDATEAVWRFIDRNLIDRASGEWLAEPGAGREPKAGLWKCPYHNGRACLETVERVARLQLHAKAAP
jgi:cellobiose epimerase